MIRKVLIAVIALLMPAMAHAAEESSGGMLGPQRTVQGYGPPPGYYPPPGYRPAPPPPVYHAPPVYHVPPPAPVYHRPYPPPAHYRPHLPPPGFTCQTRRFACSLYRPRPLGSPCECHTPWGGLRGGRVVH